MERATYTSVGGVVAAVLASLCCIGPVLLALAGLGGIAVLSAFEPYRLSLVAVTMALTGAAFYFTYRKREVKCADGTCKVEKASGWNKAGVWIATLMAAGAIAFPYYGFTAPSSPSVSLVDDKPNLSEDVSFFHVPLICNAAPAIGCGSRAKFIMLDLMNDPAVKEAWLNRKGTVMAVVWNKPTGVASRRTVLESVFSRHALTADQVLEPDRASLIGNFSIKDGWYKGSDVDALSIEEAGVIADRVLARVKLHVGFKSGEDAQAFRDDVKVIVQDCFLSIGSFNDLNDSTYHRVEREVIAAGERYLGKGNMPPLELTQEDCEGTGGQDPCCNDAKQRRKGE